MDQPTFSDLEYQGKKRKTRRELFLERMDGLVPWTKLEDEARVHRLDRESKKGTLFYLYLLLMSGLGSCFFASNSWISAQMSSNQVPKKSGVASWERVAVTLAAPDPSDHRKRGELEEWS